MSDSPEIRLERARIALEGLSIGDALGGNFELSSYDRLTYFVKERVFPRVKEWHYTDDTNMALSIYSVLRQDGEIHQDKLAQNFALHFERNRGYGMGAAALLMRIGEGQSWRDLSPNIFDGGSYGNGGAMRVAPLGAYFADDLDLAIEQAKLSAQVTHYHPEGVAGAIAVAVGTALAWKAKTEHQRPSRKEFIDSILPYIPESEVKNNCQKAADLTVEDNIISVVKVLGNGSGISAPDTVPFVLYIAGKYLDNYEEAIWQTMSGGGDVDTNAAMVGGIVATYLGGEGVPQDWINRREKLPQWAFTEQNHVVDIEEKT